MRSLLHPATAVAVIAVVISLTGTGYAVTQLPRDSVGPAQLQDGAVGLSTGLIYLPGTFAKT